MSAHIHLFICLRTILDKSVPMSWGEGTSDLFSFAWPIEKEKKRRKEKETEDEDEEREKEKEKKEKRKKKKKKTKKKGLPVSFLSWLQIKHYQLLDE